MGLNSATMNGTRVTTARVDIPAWGCWYADVALDGEVTIAPGTAATLVISDLTLVGTVLSGGPAKGRSDYRVVAGKGGWGQTIGRESYATDDGVKLATVLGDAARLVGETLAPISRSFTVGPAFTRVEGPAAHLLERLAPQAWYIDEAGTTRLGRRAAAPYKDVATHGPVDHARRTVTLAAERIATILPGIVVDGLEAVDVQHTINATDGLRSTIWGARNGGGTSRRLDALRRMAEQLDPFRDFRGVVEYRVVIQAGDRFELQPVRSSLGMPDLKRVLVRPGLAGSSSTLTPGALVLVGWIDSDPGRPYIASFASTDGSGFTPTLTHIDADVLRLAAGVRPAIGAGDLAGGIWPCIPTQVQVLV